MNKQAIETLVKQQQLFFRAGKTLPYNIRKDSLKKLEASIIKHEQDISNALYKDLGKSQTESYMCEIGLVLSEIKWMSKHLKKLMAPHLVSTPLAQFPAKSYRSPSPYGNVLIMSPWNYPILLTLEPLVDALAAGNTVIIKPSAYAPASCKVICQIIKECFVPDYVTVITGGRQENQDLLHIKFDKIFFTGSTAVGKEVMRLASEHLTPVTLELGGKSPCIIDAHCNLQLTAKRIVFGKLINCGQTCVAPDYILCDETIKDQLIEAMIKEIKAQYCDQPLSNPNYGHIINEKHFQRLNNLIDPAKVVYGGDNNADTLQIAPTIMDHVTPQDAIMQEEIFGPILPVMTYQTLDEAIDLIESHPRPLALYCFTNRKSFKNKVLTHCRFGGGCINDTLVHLATSEMPFGGVGESGVGCYHGEAGFEEFSHLRSILDQSAHVDLPIRYQPYDDNTLKIIKKSL